MTDMGPVDFSLYVWNSLFAIKYDTLQTEWALSAATTLSENISSGIIVYLRNKVQFKLFLLHIEDISNLSSICRYM